MASTKHYQIVRGNASLSVVGPLNTTLQQALSYTAKSLVQVEGKPWERRTQKKKAYVYSREQNADGTYTYLTYQGLLEIVVVALVQSGSTFHIIDNRTPFPKPRFDLMHSLRFSQEPMLHQALGQDRSGLIVAVTRYGKTAMIANTINAYPGVKTVVVAPGIDLLPQLVEALVFFCPGREIKGIYTGSRNSVQSDDITVCSMDSMSKLDKIGTRLVIVDEPHAVATGPRASELVEFENARFLGFGATDSGRWEGNDIVISGLFGPRLVVKTYLEAVEEGAICPIHVKFIKIPFKHWQVSQRRYAYKRLLESPEYLEVVRKLSADIIPEEWQSLFFISNEKQGNKVLEVIPDGVLAMDKTMKNKKERQQMFQSLKRGEILRCICSSIYSTGVTIDDIRVVVNCAEGAAGIMSVQKPGRLAEVKPGKKCGYMIDFIFECTSPKEYTDNLSYKAKAWTAVVSDCWARYNAYKEIGYDVEIVEDINQLQLT